MKACLYEATADGKNSIAFPALGTGILKCPPAQVAKLMFDCTEKFFLDHPESPIEEVMFVLHPGNMDCVQVSF